MRHFPTVCATLALAVIACGDPATPPSLRTASLSHDAYVWQRAWLPAVADAVSEPPAAIGGLRVLVQEVARDGTEVWPAVTADALARAGRPITAVVRIDGSRPIAALSLAPVGQRIEAWRAEGVQVVGIEVDHDCATAALPDYIAWLAGARPAAPLRLSITALPAWTRSAHLPALADAVDELVVQVHAVRAPRLFEAGEARRWLDGFSAAIGGRPFRVALPTYRVRVGDAQLSADPVELATFVATLRRRPVAGLRGVVWFRLPVAGDDDAWTRATLTAVIEQAPLAPAVAVHAVARDDSAFDIVVENRGTLAAPWPNLHLAGQVVDADLVAGYAAARDETRAWRAPAGRVAPGQRVVVGWATGSEIRIDAR